MIRIYRFRDTSIHYVWDWGRNRMIYWGHLFRCRRFLKELKEMGVL
jgi:hypothetical protein